MIYKKVGQFLVLICVLLTGVVHATTEADKALQDIFASFTTLKANFKQTIVDADGAVLQQSRGEMALSRPGKFRWETKHPVEQIIIADGTHVWIYDIDLEQVTRQNQDATLGNTPASLLSGQIQDLTKTFAVDKVTTRGEVQSFTLLPKEQNDLFQSLIINFKNKQLQSMTLKDNSAQTTKINFSEVEPNEVLADKLFIFHPPKGVDVIDNTAQHPHKEQK